MPTALAFREAAPSTVPFPEYLANYIKASPDFMEGIRAGVAALREGKITLWEDEEQELELGESIPN